jgi:hypothetical protein
MLNNLKSVFAGFISAKAAATFDSSNNQQPYETPLL